MFVSKRFIAPYALLPAGWACNVRIDVDPDGSIASITPDSPSGDASLLAGPVIPGMPNVHSHAFQRAFAGRAERSSGERDSFWTWRRAMYALAARITPDQLAAIAAQLYVDMLEAGYTAVGEFHYLHHDAGGVPFATRSEMAQQLLYAADETGIGMTLLPVFYRWSGFREQPPRPEQARFINDLDGFMRLFDELAPLCRTPNRRLGIAPHSLRAVSPGDLRAALAALDERDPGAPIHIHAAEQTAEVEAAVEMLGGRPVEWLLQHAAVDARWCIVHATHINAGEVTALAASGAVAGVAPTTEANLGDGIFPLELWRAAGGATAIGSDSHVSVDPAEELRWLEYTQRLRTHRRAIAPSPEALYVETARGGGRALGRPIGAIVAGGRADFVVLDANAPTLHGADAPTILDRFIIAGGPRTIRDVFVGGARVVERGRHVERESITARYRHAMSSLIA
ncbi:MAG: formimidoylglutamate deiminase [Candidatus Velthaea sp.]